jgi:hypothetical protein
MKGILLGAILAGAVAATACAPPPTLIPPVQIRVDASYPCREADTTTSTDPDRCVFWRTAEGKVYYGPASMVHVPPAGTDEIIPPPYLP